MAAAIVQPLTRPRVAMLIASADSQFRRRCLEEAGGYDKPNHEVERGHMRSLSSANVIVAASFWTGGCPTWMQAKWQDSYVNAIHAPQSKWWIPEWLPRPHWRVKASQITAASRIVCEQNQEASAKIRRGLYFARRSRLLLLDGFVFCVAERFEIASDASRFASDANPAAMPNQLVGKLDPLVLRQNIHQILLDLLGFFLLCEFQPPCESQHMGIDHNATRNSVSRAQDYVGRLARHSWQREHLFHRSRHFATELFHNSFAGAHH